MTRSWRRSFAPLLLVTVLGVGGCSDDDEGPTSPSPTPTPAPTVSETFTGSLVTSGANSHNFTVTANGETRVRLTAIEPLNTLSLGVGIGTVDNTLTPPCRVFGQDTSARLNEDFLTSGLASGPYCVVVRDVGNIFPGVTVSYEVRVTHP